MAFIKIMSLHVTVIGLHEKLVGNLFQSACTCYRLIIFSNLPHHPAEGAAPPPMLSLMPKEFVSIAKMIMTSH